MQLPEGALKVATLVEHKGTTAGWKNTFAKLIKVIGELKLREPHKRVCAHSVLTVKAQMRNAVPSYRNMEGSETILYGVAFW